MPGIPGAAIREAESLPEHLEGGSNIGPRTQAKPGALQFDVPGIARYLIRDGKSIEVQAAPNADRDAVELLLHSNARGTLIHQRGELALNAVTLVAPDFRCVAICGPSGFGKSTLAAELCRHGWSLVSDEVTRITWNGSMAVAWPSTNRLKLWRNACEDLALDVNKLKRVRAGLEKYFVTVPAATSPAALSVVVTLRVSMDLATMQIPAAKCSNVLSENTYRARQIGPLGRDLDHARIVGQVARTCRPILLDGARRATIALLADALEKAIR